MADKSHALRFERLKARASARGIDWIEEFHGLDMLATMVAIARRLGVKAPFDPSDVLDLSLDLERILGE